MAISFPCPECKAIVTYDDDWAGQRAPCRRCGAYTTVPSQSTASPDQIAAGSPPPGPPPLPASEGFTDQPAPPVSRGYEERREERYPSRDDDERGYGRDDDYGYSSRRDVAPGWNVTRIGLGMMFWSYLAGVILLVVFVAFMFAMVGLHFGRGGFGRGPDMTWGMLSLMFGGGMLISGLVYIVGQAMCCAVPRESGAKGYAIGSIVCLGLAILLYLLFVFLFVAVRHAEFGGGGFGPRGNMGTALLPLVFGLIALVAIVLWQVFLALFIRNVARYFNNHALAQSTSGYLTLYFVMLGLSFLVQCMGIAIRNQDAAMVLMCLGFVVLALAIAVIIWLLVLFYSARATITRGQRGY